MPINYDDLDEVIPIFKGMRELEDLRRVVDQVDAPSNVTFPMSLQDGCSVDLTLPKEDFIFILTRNIQAARVVLSTLGIVSPESYDEIIAREAMREDAYRNKRL